MGPTFLVWGWPELVLESSAMVVERVAAIGEGGRSLKGGRKKRKQDFANGFFFHLPSFYKLHQGPRFCLRGKGGLRE